ncbi:MAG: zinc ribbon domain-containing protein [Nanoarchaeota archaeon]|nr:zinc ribbon domain-containing protein [Nanoarchaeota archaeon]
MFNKKSCANCGEKLKENYEFCPSCGIHLKSNSKKDWGMLGKNDALNRDTNSEFGNFGGGFLNRMIGNTLKMLEKEMQKEMKQFNSPNKLPSSNIRLMINGKEVKPNMIGMQKKNKMPRKTLPINFSEENLKRYQNAKKEEPKTQVRRIGDKLNYELEVPGVNSINDISITRLANGIEVRAIAEKNAYSKIININLPLTRYLLSKEKLMLELDTENDSQSL